MNNINYILGQSIKKIRVSKNMSHKELAKLCGISESHLKNIENGNRGITVDFLEIILNNLEINEYIFFKDLK